MPQYVNRSAAAMKATTHTVPGTFARTRGRSGSTSTVETSVVCRVVVSDVSDFSVESAGAVMVIAEGWTTRIAMAIVRRSKYQAYTSEGITEQHC